MTAAWNFERRRDTCTRFLVGVWALSQGVAGRDTSLEAVRSRMRLSPEEALFAARRLRDDELIGFEPGGAVRSNARGVERADAAMRGVRARVQRPDDAAAALRAGGTTVQVIAAVIRADGAAIDCGAGDDGAAHRVALVGDAVVLERQGVDGAWGPASVED